MKANKLTKETIANVHEQDRGFPKFNIGDTIEVALIVKEGSKERIQLFMGYVIASKKSGISSTFTVRKIGANNIGVEKIFPYYSPVINGIKLIKKGKIRRAKLYYIRERIGKSAKIKEKIETKRKKKAVKKSTEQKKAVTKSN